MKNRFDLRWFVLGFLLGTMLLFLLFTTTGCSKELMMPDVSKAQSEKLQLEQMKLQNEILLEMLKAQTLQVEVLQEISKSLKRVME